MKTIFLNTNNVVVLETTMDASIPEGVTYVVEGESYEIVTPEFPKNRFIQRVISIRPVKINPDELQSA